MTKRFVALPSDPGERGGEQVSQASHPIERYSVDDLLARKSEIRVMAPRLGPVAVHWHDFYELGYVVDGSARHVVNGVEQAIRPGSAFLLSPADFHEIVPTSSGPLACYNVVIGPAVLERHLDALVPPGSDWSPWSADEFADVAPDFERLEREGAGDAPGKAIAMDAVLTRIVVELARRSGAVGGHDSRASQSVGAGEDVRRAVAYVERHFREPLTLADVAGVAHLSPNYFSERFRATTGTSFQTYLQNRRLQFGRSLLASTDLSVADVCHAAGFNSLSHFGRAYRRRYGESPSATAAVSRSHIEGALASRFS
jgi:AraC-like DNA-binding protein/mannose-6-phosphate isomerase-like protein (cupin superfamily)